MILKKLELGSFATNCYIVGSESGNEGMIIDPADDVQAILSNVNDLGLDIKSIVLTHGHLDHIGALEEAKEATGADVIIHSDDVAILQDQSLSMLFGLSYPTPSLPDRLLKDGDSIDFGGLHFQVLHTPGHTPGGICLQGHGIVFSGDTLFNYGIGRADLLGGNHSQLLNSIHRRLMVLPDDTIIYPGHGPDSTIGAERQGNPFLSDQSGI